MIRLCALLLAVASTAEADALVATRTIRAQEIIAPSDLELKSINVNGGLTDPEVLIGQEARVALYPGRPVRANDVTAPALVERNQIIPLIYLRGTLEISAEARALGRAAAGDRIRVMNLSSRNSVFATIGDDGSAYVGKD